MAKYFVEVPVVLKLMVGGVEAGSEAEAIEKVMCDSGISIDAADVDENFEWIDWEWEMHDQVVEGNVYHGGLNEPYAQKEE